MDIIGIDSFDFDLFSFSQVMNEPIINIKAQLRSLETSHSITVKPSEPCLLITLLQSITEEDIKQVISILQTRQQVFGLIQFLMIRQK